MVNSRETALALKDLISLRLKDNPFPLENIIVHVNNNLPIEDKFCATRELATFADSISSGNPVHGVNNEKRIRAIQKMLDLFWFLIENKTYDYVEFPNLENYYKKLNKDVNRVSIEQIEVHENRQWAFIRDNYLNNAKEQIIFNYKPAEIGDDNDPRTRKLRRDLIRNLGLVTGTDYTSIDELKEKKFKDLYEGTEHELKDFVKETVIDTDFELLFPDDYVNNITERLNLYNKLSELKTEEKLQKFEENLVDRFGELPTEVVDLLDSVRIKWIAITLGLERVIMKQNRMVGYFIADQESMFYQSDIFGKVLAFVQNHTNIATIKQKNTRNGLRLIITFEKINSTEKALHSLKQILD